ncbi:hypothetical protein HMPREF9372_3133 [Sporosarcina newyorkensis 2681]|uniref:Uncharacterized protein n=1 Tax=Sporosarcina newyorkensis 2681 TaxID=1027292 RepID=F9DWF2_9BACL|nr:hypothetical protein [Sporosarcina newyorkensis]EGQ21773.1 hypothetical protein HMPREF9372_3133 [Sporosarcina newyorkensis 2681]
MEITSVEIIGERVQILPMESICTFVWLKGFGISSRLDELSLFLFNKLTVCQTTII